MKRKWDFVKTPGEWIGITCIGMSLISVLMMYIQQCNYWNDVVELFCLGGGLLLTYKEGIWAKVLAGTFYFIFIIFIIGEFI